jgi:hypothetical protein
VSWWRTPSLKKSSGDAEAGGECKPDVTAEASVDSEIIAIIPVGGDSKGIEGKNIRPVASKPLLAYGIEHARGMAAIKHVIVSTDAPEVFSRQQADWPFPACPVEGFIWGGRPSESRVSGRIPRSDG